MPTYEYKCDACGNAFEKFQSMSSAAIKKCPACGKNKVRRLMGVGAGLIFKGSGFYITDYRDKAYTDKAKAETGGSESTPATETKTGSDSKFGENKGSETKSASDSAPVASQAPAKPEAAPKSESKPTKKKRD